MGAMGAPAPHSGETSQLAGQFAGSKPLATPLFELRTLCLAPAMLLHA